MSPEIHTFSYGTRELAYVIATGEFFEVDDVCKDILSFNSESRQTVIVELSRKYTTSRVISALDELEALDLVSFGPVELSGEIDGVRKSVSQSLLEIDSRPHKHTMLLHVSHACNIKCSYCFALGGSYGGKSEIMSWETARQAVDWLLAISEASRECQIDFFGGEPLLAIDLMRQVVTYARRKAAKQDITVNFGITTNGTLLDSDSLEFLMSEDIGIMVSIDGPKQDHNEVRKFHNGADTFDVVAQGVRAVVDRNPGHPLILRSTLTSNNLDMADVAAKLDAFGVEQVVLAPSWESPHSPTSIRMEHVDELNSHIRRLSDDELQSLIQDEKPASQNFHDMIRQVMNPDGDRKYGCSGGKSLFAVDVKGDIYFCSAFGSLPEYKMGDVWNGLDREKEVQFRTELHVDNRKGCSTCWARNLCGGGCAYDARVSTGSWEGPNPVACERKRYSYELAMGMALELQDKNPGALERLQA